MCIVDAGCLMYYTLVLMKDAAPAAKITTTAKATLQLNGFAIDESKVDTTKLTIKDWTK